MNTFIEKNKQLLKFYYIVSHIIGYSLLIKLGADVILVLTGYYHFSTNIGLAISLLDLLLLGFIALGIGMFIRYLYDTEYRAGRILRHLNLILHSYAGFYLISRIGLLYLVKGIQNAGPCYSQWGSLGENIIPVVAVTFVYLGLAQILKRLLPMIEESRTLI